MLILNCKHLKVFLFWEKGGFMKKIKEFFKDVKKEISKVKWPTKKNMAKYTVTTVLFVVFFALFFFATDAVVALIKTLGV